MPICPICGSEYSAPPALSRKDNKTPICPDCGTREALQAAGADDQTIKAIIDEIHSHTDQNHGKKVNP